jgi:hypothetical protein
MMRPFAVEKDSGASDWSGDERSDDELYRALIYCAPDEDDDGTPSEGEVFLAKAKNAGVNVGGLVRAMRVHRRSIGGWAQPFDDCTWPQALEYAEKALPWSVESERYAWAIRYMWCLELPEPRDTLDADEASAPTSEGAPTHGT